MVSWWEEELVCPNCMNMDGYQLYHTMKEYPFRYSCEKCGYEVVVNSRNEEIKTLVRRRIRYVNEVKLTMWD